MGSADKLSGQGLSVSPAALAAASSSSLLPPPTGQIPDVRFVPRVILE